MLARSRDGARGAASIVAARTLGLTSVQSGTFNVPGLSSANVVVIVVTGN